MKKKLSIQIISRRVIPLFILLILFFTIASRILDSITVPKVKIDYLQQKVISYEVSGSGNIEAGELTTISTKQGLIIKKIDIFAGKAVEAGAPLFSYQMEELEEMYHSVEHEIEKLKLSLQSEIENSSTIPKMSSAELANQKLDKAETVLAKTQTNYQSNLEEYNNKVAELTKIYQRDKDKSITERLDEKYRDYMAAERNYETALIEEEEAVNKAEEDLEDAERKLEAGEDTEQEELRQKVQSARRALYLTVDKHNLKIDEADQNRETKKKAYENVRNGLDDGIKEVETDYEMGLKELRTELKIVETELESAQSDFENAVQELKNSQILDQNSAEEIAKKSTISQLEQKSILLSIEEKNREMNKISELMVNGGQVKASSDGIVTKISINLGQVATGNEIVQIGYGELLLRGIISKADSELITAGDRLSLSKNGNLLSADVCTLESIVPMAEEDRVEIMARVESTRLRIGEKVDYKIKSSSEVYEKVIPTSAIHKDKDEEYVLVAQDKDTVLGIEQVAMKVPIKILERNASIAAVEGNLLKDHKIIIEEWRSITEGDRIRVVYK